MKEHRKRRKGFAAFEANNDWLDSGESRIRRASHVQKSHKKVSNPESSGFLDPALAKGTVVEVFPKLCRVVLDSNGTEILCTYRRAQILQSGADQPERSPVAPGDRVDVDVMGSKDGRVLGVCERQNKFFRPAPGRTGLHILATNLTGCLLVTSALDPTFSPGFVDRFLVACEICKVTPLVLVNKVEKWMNSPEFDQNAVPPWQIYRDLGYAVHEVSVKESIGFDLLKEFVSDGVFLFMGHSGVGKTSLLRKLLGRDVGKVGEVNRVTTKGKHTTTSSVMYVGGERARWIDSPGVKSFGLEGMVAPPDLRLYFPEFRNLPCQQTGCDHLGEDVDCGAVGFERYDSYLRIYESL